MILNCLSESFKNLEFELRRLDNDKVKSYLIEFDRCIARKDQEVIIQRMIVTALMKTAILGKWSQLYFEDKIVEQFEYLLTHICETHQTVTVKVSLEDYPNQLYRVIKIPYMIKLDDFCYCILAGLKAQECKQFSLEVNNVNRYGCGQEIGDNEMDQFLSVYHIDENSNMKLYYDFDKTYIFNVEVLSIQEDSSKSIEFIEGNGYGVWENGVEYLRLYYQDKNQFIEVMNKKGLDIDDFYIESFDLNLINKEIIDDIETLKIKYNMKYEERKVFCEYFPFTL